SAGVISSPRSLVRSSWSLASFMAPSARQRTADLAPGWSDQPGAPGGSAAWSPPGVGSEAAYGRGPPRSHRCVGLGAHTSSPPPGTHATTLPWSRHLGNDRASAVLSRPSRRWECQLMKGLREPARPSPAANALGGGPATTDPLSDVLRAVRL